MIDYVMRWRALRRPAWLYLAHAALLTGSLAITSLLFNLAVLALGFPRGLLGTLTIAGVATAGALSLPLWWLVGRGGQRGALIASASLQTAGALTVALWPADTPLLLAAAATGAAAVLFQVSAAPYMMRHSDDETRDHLFSANAAVNIGVAGLGSVLAGQLPALCARLLGVAAESAAAYRASFAVAAAGLALSIVPLLLRQDSRGLDHPRARAWGGGGLRLPQNIFFGGASPLRASPDRKTGGRAANPWLTAKGQTLHVQQEAAKSPSSAIAAALRGVTALATGAVQRTHPPPRFSVYRLAFSLSTLQLLIPPALISCGAALLAPYLNLFFKERFALPDGALGALFAALGVSTGLATLAGPLISARIGKARTVALTQALSIPFLLAVGFAPALGVAAAAAVIRGALFNMGSPLYDALAMERTPPAARPAVIGLINAAYAGGYLALPAVSVAVQERWGFAPLFLATAACYALAVLATAWFFARGTSA
ncbi:MAG TPA: MFS transporter [Roseiflexaceae bacterium]|nr:MFS transporter [Roseiflexaceae bacterium]